MRIRENDMSRGQKMKICSLGNCIVNNYLIPCDEGYILIDTGYGCEQHAKENRTGSH